MSEKLRKRMIHFMYQDTSLFGSRVASFSTDRDPKVQWETTQYGIVLTKPMEDGSYQRARIPWHNIANLTEFFEQEPEADERQVTARGPSARKP